ncbi:SDR family oxidoreductase [Indioceanicola profundi]|uniref:SDR family oxidoreductase n=1 Tax=Indioceanicola profundi TaxID=2220096 RepID=UPI000E6AAC74|nr:SDR family oxidoreductase [Indioceanicola profundi]
MHSIDISGQVAIVTGASSGIGQACAVELARAGARVAVNHRNSAEEAGETLEMIRDCGGEGTAVQGDVSVEADVERMFANVVEQYGTVDILVANAGIQQDASLTEMTLGQWEKVIAVNLTGQFLCARAAIREFLRRGPRPEISRSVGKIICMSSVHQVIPWAGRVNYAASKGGIELMMQSIAQEYAEKGVRVNAVAPGAIRTAINTEAWKNEAARDRLLKLIPQGRIGEPEDVGRAVAWLASDLSDYVNGTTLFVDGGMTLYPGFRGNG